MSKSKSLKLKVEVKDGRSKIYLRIASGDKALFEFRLDLPTKLFIAFIASTSAVAELLSRYPQIAAILRTVINGG